MLICLSSSLEKYMINVAYYHYLQKIGGRCFVCHRPKMQIAEHFGAVYLLGSAVLYLNYHAHSWCGRVISVGLFIRLFNCIVSFWLFTK
jgi:hypothetical protein